MKGTAIYPGTFDPVTRGHIDICERALKMFDHVVIGVADSLAKEPFFNIDERLDMLETVFEHNKQISVRPFSGLLIDFAPGNVHWVPWSILGMAHAATALALSACVVGHLTARFTTWSAAAILLSESALAGFLDTVMKSPTSVSTLKIRG